MNSFAKLEELIRAFPDYPEALEKAAAAERDARKRYLDELARLDAEARKAWPSQEKRKAASAAGYEAALEALKTASTEHQRTVAEVGRERGIYENQRRQIELALMAGTRELVDGFEKTCRDALDDARATASTAAAADPRLKSILQTLRSDLPRLRLYPDVAALPDEFARIRANWPALSAEASPPLTRARPAPDGMGFRPREST